MIRAMPPARVKIPTSQTRVSCITIRTCRKIIGVSGKRGRCCACIFDRAVVGRVCCPVWGRPAARVLPDPCLGDATVAGSRTGSCSTMCSPPWYTKAAMNASPHRTARIGPSAPPADRAGNCRSTPRPATSTPLSRWPDVEPDEVHLPGVFVQRVVALTAEQATHKAIEQRTTRGGRPVREDG